MPGSVRCSSALCLYIFLLNHLPVCVHVYQCMYMSTSVCTCLPVYVHVYQCVYMFTSVCKCLSSWSGPINRYAYIRNTDTKYIFPTDITIENKYMCVCVWVFFSVSFLDLCGRKRRFPANRQADKTDIRHESEYRGSPLSVFHEFLSLTYDRGARLCSIAVVLSSRRGYHVFS